MKLPRDLSGRELAGLLRRYGYVVVRQSGSHMRVSSTLKKSENHLTIPDHRALRTGTLNRILNQVATYLEMDRNQLNRELFG
jgi:predicted RNA binding protein YcfA (HicA-like mRNA interferase family)